MAWRDPAVRDPEDRSAAAGGARLRCRLKLQGGLLHGHRDRDEHHGGESKTDRQQKDNS